MLRLAIRNFAVGARLHTFAGITRKRYNSRLPRGARQLRGRQPWGFLALVPRNLEPDSCESRDDDLPPKS
jgi:hypothetical protein